MAGLQSQVRFFKAGGGEEKTSREEMSIGFVGTGTEQRESRGIWKMDARSLESGILAQKLNEFQRAKGCIWFSPNVIFSDAERKKNALLLTCGLPKSCKVNVCGGAAPG